MTLNLALKNMGAITKVRESFEAEDYPMPTIKEIDGGVSVWIKRFSLEKLVARNKKRYGEKVPNIGVTDMKNVGNYVGSKTYHRKRPCCYVRYCQT